MTSFTNLGKEEKVSVYSGRNDWIEQTACSLSRESEMIAKGTWGALAEVAEHPKSVLPELVISAATGSALGACNRLGAPGRILSAAAGTAMLLKVGYDEWSANRWSLFGAALKSAWISDNNMDKNIEITKNSLGQFLVDTGIGAAGMKFGSLTASRFAPPKSLVADALKRADRDAGTALHRLQNRFEDAGSFKKQTQGKLDFIAHSQPANAGDARGDLIRIATTPDGNILLTAMDVEGHGLKAAKKAILVHKAIDDVLPHTQNKSASDILSMIDGKLSSKDELAITAGMMKFNPQTRVLETATASSQFAYLVKASGQVRQLDAEVGGLGLGTDMYSYFPRGNETTVLNPGDVAIMASDGVFDRFGYGNKEAFESFLLKTGPSPKKIRQGILQAPAPPTGADDASFIVFTPS